MYNKQKFMFYQKVIDWMYNRFICNLKLTTVARVSYATARTLHVRAALDSLDPRHLRHRLACPWRSISMYTTTAAVARSLKRGRCRKQLGCHCSCSLYSRRYRDASLFRCTEEISPAKYRQSIISSCNNIAKQNIVNITNNITTNISSNYIITDAYSTHTHSRTMSTTQLKVSLYVQQINNNSN